jgi:hypothetical protein
MISRMVFPFVGLALAIITTASPRAHAERHELSVGTATRFTGSDSAQALSDDSLVLFSVTGGYRLERVRVPGFEFLIDGALELGGMSGTAFRTLHTSATVQLAAVGARLRRELSRRWSGQARANLGGARVHVEIEDMFTRGHALSDSAYTMTAYLGGGADLLLSTKRRADGSEQFSLGLSAELGYMAMVPVTMEATPETRGSDDIIRIPEMSASLGSLDLSAVSLRFGLVGRF